MLQLLKQFQILQLIPINIFSFDFSTTNFFLINLLVLTSFLSFMYYNASQKNYLQETSFFFSSNSWQKRIKFILNIINPFKNKTVKKKKFQKRVFQSDPLFLFKTDDSSRPKKTGHQIRYYSVEACTADPTLLTLLYPMIIPAICMFVVTGTLFYGGDCLITAIRHQTLDNHLRELYDKLTWECKDFPPENMWNAQHGDSEAAMMIFTYLWRNTGLNDVQISELLEWFYIQEEPFFGINLNSEFCDDEDYDNIAKFVKTFRLSLYRFRWFSEF